MVESVQVYHYDAFSTEPHKGNPAGIVLDAEKLTDSEMQKIASSVGFNETAFPLKSDKADLKIRFFTPGHEMNLCGHATIATIYALKEKKLLKNKPEYTIETKAGILSIGINEQNDNKIYIIMQHAVPKFETYTGSNEDLAQSLGIKKEDISDDLPVLYGSTGVWTLLVPVNSLATCKKMKPNHSQFPSILKEKPNVSIHPFCFETYDLDSDMHARHFSSPFSGTTEDPVTGTASGVMGAYFLKYVSNKIDNSLELIVEQGQELGKNGKVQVKVTPNENEWNIQIVGTAVYVQTFKINLNQE
ncbi:PhzF family phenazine biosynthesis isomerase [Staphylococcus kloosii]|uniref:PhzF family phenazine biosynthesis isomerase n=1 Tax=Staphylococcus kloosii TaxID=29384 RepID=UPI0028A2DE91|nr:PhzF family phenazine biosynthesis isomerase [Staphylococcus kloosii]MDT3958599.1 PhzF family phenazine biosynthesis isomerase [Staphylococcus kloosii]